MKPALLSSEDDCLTGSGLEYCDVKRDLDESWRGGSGPGQNGGV